MLQGKTALVTGSVRGIGESVARALAAKGCNIMLNGLGEPDEVERTRASIAKDYGVRVVYHGADLAKRADIEDMMQAVEREFGGLNILINNAVIRYYKLIPDFDPDQWDHAMAVNVTAPFNLCRLALPMLRKAGWGRVINLSSTMGLAGRSGRVDYITSKHAMIGLTRAVAAETLRDPDITCNALCPGSVLTPFIRARIQGLADARGISWDEMAVQYRKDVGQDSDFITPERMAAIMVFLCSDDAKDISAVALSVDSGRAGTWMEPVGV